METLFRVFYNKKTHSENLNLNNRHSALTDTPHPHYIEILLHRRIKTSVQFFIIKP